MRICLLAPTYMDLYCPIVEELERQGHQVTFVEDKMFDFDWKYPYRSFFDRLIRKIDCVINRRFENYWNGVFSARCDLNQHFDELIVVNGCSFHKSFLRRIKFYNKKIKTVLYLWDNSSFYDYFQYNELLDKVMTYDINDSEKYAVKLLPFYWQQSQCVGVKEKYKLSMIGSNHSGRLQIARSVSSQLKKQGYPYYIKVLDGCLKEDEIIINHAIPLMDVLNIIMESECVLDTDRASQTGTTPRLIWALAMGKKVITTNLNIKRMPLYHPDRISFIDRNNPVLDNKFLALKIDQKEQISYLSSLRLDNWIKNFLI